MNRASSVAFAGLWLSVAALRAAEEPSVVLAPGPIWMRHTIDNTSRGADGVKLGDENPQRSGR